MAAKKKTTSKPDEKKTGTKRAAKASGADASVASETAPKTATPKAGKKASAAKAEAPKAAKKAAAAPVKLNDRQAEFLKKVHQTGETGYEVGQKVEQRTIDALAERKLLKRGAKNKETGKHRYTLTKAGHKHLGSGASTGQAQESK